MNKSNILIVLAAVAVLLLAIDETSVVFVLKENEQAIVTQVGEYRRSVEMPGLHFKTPFVQTVHRMERRILARDIPSDEYLTLDKKKLVADPIVRWRITDPRLFYITVRDEGRARRRLDDIVKSEMRDEISARDFGDIVGQAREPLMENVAGRVRKNVEPFGIFVVDVRIKRADLPSEVTESVFQRMQAERDRVAKGYQSEGAMEAQKMRAETDKEVTILKAEAYAKAQQLKGEGDAKAAKLYADAYNQDPELYAFLKSLETYETSIKKQSKVVLSTESALFKYLASPAER